MGVFARMRYFCRVIPIVIITTCCQVLFADVPVAGVKPYERPQHAPTIISVDHGNAWYERALTGISRPYPANLRFLEHQGNWYTPFVYPGMEPPYDIRGWHR